MGFQLCPSLNLPPLSVRPELRNFLPSITVPDPCGGVRTSGSTTETGNGHVVWYREMVSDQEVNLDPNINVDYFQFVPVSMFKYESHLG